MSERRISLGSSDRILAFDFSFAHEHFAIIAANIVLGDVIFYVPDENTDDHTSSIETRKEQWNLRHTQSLSSQMAQGAICV